MSLSEEILKALEEIKRKSNSNTTLSETEILTVLLSSLLEEEA